MQSREGWTRAESGPKVIKGKTYKSLTEFIRSCSVCNRPFSIYVTDKIASGIADSNSFGLRNCEEHRRSRTVADNTELEALRSYKGTTAEELKALYVRNSELFNEVQVLKARLATYELKPMFETFNSQTAIGCETVQNTTDSNLTFPWQQR